MGELVKWLLDLIRGLNPLLVVSPWEKAVLVRGKWSWDRGPGIWWKIPWLDKVYLLSCRMRSASFNRASFTTRDNKTFTISGAVFYHVNSVSILLRCTDMGEDVLMKEAGDLCREYANLHYANKLDADGMKAHVITGINHLLEGIEVLGVKFVDFAEVPVIHLAQSNAWGNTYQGGVLNTSTPVGKVA